MPSKFIIGLAMGLTPDTLQAAATAAATTLVVRMRSGRRYPGDTHRIMETETISANEFLKKTQNVNKD